MEITRLVESFKFRFQAAAIDNSQRVAEELLAHVFNCKPMEIYTTALLQDASTQQKITFIRRLEPLAQRIEAGEPMQYVLGHVDFWGLEIKCDPRALIPRPETELLVEEVLSSRIWTREHHQTPATVIDVGTGTGCIVLTLAQQRPDASFTAVDISAEALELARENARSHGLEDRVLWKQNTLLESFDAESCDAVVANLPYIATDEWKKLPRSVRDHEPTAALDSGPSGMELIGELVMQARNVLVPGGMLFLEFGHGQGQAVAECLEKHGYADIQIKHDLAGLDRIAIATNP